MGDAASVERVNILVDIVISVVLKRLNSDLETVVDSGACGPVPSSAHGVPVECGRWSVSGWGGSGWPCACVRRGTRDPGGGRDVQTAEGECVLSFYFTNNNPEEKKGINKRATFQEQSKPFLRGSAA